MHPHEDIRQPAMEWDPLDAGIMKVQHKRRKRYGGTDFNN